MFMRSKIWRSMALTAVLAVLLFAILSMALLYSVFTARTERELDHEANMVAAAMEGGAELSTLAATHPDGRMTHIAQDGSVLFDSDAEAGEMENHLERPEIQQALTSGTGSSTRQSDTLGEMTIYRAIRLDDGTVLRVSGTQKNVLGMVLQLIPAFLALIVVTVILSALASRQATKRIVAPVNALDLDHPLDNDVYEELSPLLKRMDDQRKRIDETVSALTAQRNEFAAVTSNMAEALVLLNARGEVLSVNRAAEKLLGLPRSVCEGKYLLALNRNFQLSEAMEAALRGENAEQEMEMNGRHYRCVASPVKDEGRVSGAVMLIPDVTDRFLAEKARREFTANVSHELKTPLTSILGYAEIMQNGVAGEDKLRQFAGLIHAEATRLIQLVEDILKLSRLDENRLPDDRRRVSLKGLCEEAASRLAPEAEKRGVSIKVEGGECAMEGSPSMLGELVYNLLDNAVKYNRENGSVVALLEENADGSRSLTVSDTGVGIDPADQEHVFERFFRGDRSRSSEGGTGLGLSIVKHAALAHGAKVSLSSKVGKGTSIRVDFPA